MEQAEVIKRLCHLVTQVGSNRFSSSVRHDCFCGETLLDPDRYPPHVDTEVIEFIEQAVKDRLDNLKL